MGWDYWHKTEIERQNSVHHYLRNDLSKWLYPCVDEQGCYIRLLDAWRSISDEERAKIAGATAQA